MNKVFEDIIKTRKVKKREGSLLDHVDKKWLNITNVIDDDVRILLVLLRKGEYKNKFLNGGVGCDKFEHKCKMRMVNALFKMSSRHIVIHYCLMAREAGPA